MRIVRSKPLADCSTAREALGELCAGFAGSAGLEMDFEVVEGAQMPEPARRLLDHQKHMTRTLEAHYGGEVRVHVMERHREGDLYSRKISLSIGDDPRVVEYGLVRLDFRYMSEAVGREVVEEKMPLGAIMINHHVLRRVQPRWFVKFPAGCGILRWFGCDAGPLHGRLGTIYCNHEPAIEVLEIVTMQGRSDEATERRRGEK